MRRLLPLIIACTLLPAWAGPIERELEARWRGAWVILNAEVHSNCNSAHTNNRVNGRLVQSRGSLVFPEGELAQVSNLDVKRSRVDVLLKLYEPRLVAHQDGPFTLYDRLDCRIELEIEVPREFVKKKQIDALDGALLEIMQRQESFAQAQGSNRWNQRLCEDFPEGYENTLRKYEIWKIEQSNAQIDARLAELRSVLARIADSLTSDADYLAGFAAGVKHARQLRAVGDCAILLRERLEAPRPKAPVDAVEERWERGYADGYLLHRALRIQRHLPGCYLPLPTR